jgi:PAS domain S-box-containing protein
MQANDLGRRVGAYRRRLPVAVVAAVGVAVSLSAYWLVPAAVVPPEGLAAGALGIGLLLTAIVILYVFSSVSGQDRVDRLIGDHRRELSQVNSELEEKAARLRTTEAALRDAEARQQDFAEAASDWFWEMDDQFRFSWVSLRFGEKIGISENQVRGRKLWQVTGIEPAEHGNWRHIRDALKSCQPFRDFDCTVRAPSGEMHTVRFGGRPHFHGKTDTLLGYRGTATDITRQILSQQQAARGHRQLLSAMDSMPDGMALYDADDRLVYCNKRGQEMCRPIADVNRPGVAYETLLRAWLDRGYVPEAAGREEEWVQGRLAAHHNPTGPIEVRRGDRVVEVRDNRAADGSIFQVAIDVTNARLGEEQLRRVQKMEAVGTFASGIAHDFNNILGVIRGYADLAQGASPPGTPVADHLIQIVRSVERASAVTKALLAFTSKRAPETQIVDLTRLLGEQTFLLKPLLKSKIELTIQSEGAPGFARIDPDLFGQAIVNLAINARDAMPDGGQLQIAIDSPDEVSNLRLPDGSPGWVRVTVTDTGMGMDSTTCARIFEPFFTTKEQGKGTGLGLAMVYSIVTQAGGSISVASEPGWGTTFTIYLPAVVPPSGPGDGLVLVAEIAASPARRTGETILLAEDEPELRTLLSQVLSTAGYRVLTAFDGGAALELYDANAVDLLVTDIVMPRLDGLKLAALCREIQPAVPVIYITGDPGRGGHDAADIPFGATVLFKPFHPQRLVEAVAAAIAGRTIVVEEEAI